MTTTSYQDAHDHCDMRTVLQKIEDKISDIRSAVSELKLRVAVEGEDE